MTHTHKKFKRTLFIFRRDLRLHDNTGLIAALKNSECVIPCFIFTPEQIDKNPYRSDAGLQFMIESLIDLNEQLIAKNGKLYLFHDAPLEVIQRCFKELHIDQLVINRDYTPYARLRDQKIEQICKQHGIVFESYDDALLHPPEVTIKPSSRPPEQDPYTVFTPFFRNASRLPVEMPEKLPQGHFYNQKLSFAVDETIYAKILPLRSKSLAAKGGRTEGERLLANLSRYENYGQERDFPALGATTGLSAHLKFTTLSPREIYHQLRQLFGFEHELIRALHWRDFFTSIAYFFPYVFKGAFHAKYDQIVWENDEKKFKRWCEGQTGFPIIDAGMRELNTIGFMHNRVRMIVASFLTKDLHIDWRWGERYFAQKLIDYDPAVNNGNWQWAASTGCDAQPYFRIFNPWLQQEKFDPDCLYIKRWVPELKSYSSKTIHTFFKQSGGLFSGSYPEPMVDHSVESKKALQSYKLISQ